MKCLLALSALGAVVFSSAARAQNLVDLSWEPANQSVLVGDMVEVQLIATSDGVTQQPFGALDAILEWDPAVLLFVGSDDTDSGYAWFVSGFLTDPDGINANLTDGDALYTALASPALPANAPLPPGLIVTTMRFVALAESAGTIVSFTPALGVFGRTRVLDFFSPGVEITGDIGSFATIGVTTPGAIQTVCYGDGDGGVCGCGNDGDAGEGCANSTGSGALISGIGVPSLTSDSFEVITTQIPNSPGLTFQGNMLLPLPPTFGDGIRCCGGSVVRWITVLAQGNCASTNQPAGCGTQIGEIGGLISQHPGNGALQAGDSRCYQHWYRDPGIGNPCGIDKFNLSPAILVTWQI